MSYEKYRYELEKTGISSKEVSAILNDLEKCKKAGVSDRNIEIILNKLISESRFRKNFINDYKSALRSVGMDPQPSP